jgi:transposase-like protein
VTNIEPPLLKPAPDPEVSDRPLRRTFTAEYKLRILREIDAIEPGKAGEVLRREGLYSSHLVDWRRKREAGELQGLSVRKQGRPKRPQNPLEPKVLQLERELARAQEELRKAHIIIEVQKKVSEMLGILAPHERIGRNG